MDRREINEKDARLQTSDSRLSIKKMAKDYKKRKARPYLIIPSPLAGEGEGEGGMNLRTNRRNGERHVYPF